MATQWPLVKTRLLTLLPTLSGWATVTVYNGPPVTADSPLDYCTVGYVADEHAGSWTSVQDPDGGQRQEAGTVRCQLTSQTGDTDLPTVEARVFVLIDALEAEIRRDRRLGVLSPEGYADLAVDVLSTANEAGTAATLTWTVTYYTVT